VSFPEQSTNSAGTRACTRTPERFGEYASAVTRGRFKIDGFDGQRGQLALELLGKGEPVSIGDTISLRCESAVLRIEVASAWRTRRAITHAVADAELRTARRTVEVLLADPSVATVVGDRQPLYELVLDYDTGTLLIATLQDDQTRMKGRD
jgi:hypothetical protein